MKELTLCNFDFLLAAVRTISVSYLRSILEHARFYLLDRDVELIYYTVRKASDALTRDTLQLGAQIICWLRPCSGKRFKRESNSRRGPAGRLAGGSFGLSRPNCRLSPSSPSNPNCLFQIAVCSLIEFC